MKKIAELRSRKGTTTWLGYDFESPMEEMVAAGHADCCIVSTEDGFSPLGNWKEYFAASLGTDTHTIGDLAGWNRFENDQISLIGLPNRNRDGSLKGVILAAGESALCYEQFAVPFYGRPYRDFYYNVAYESIAYASKVLGAQRIALSHLSSSNRFHQDIATCIAEALAHFCDEEHNPPIHSLIFVGCCIKPEHFSGIPQLNTEGDVTRHRTIRRSIAKRNGFDVVSFDWRSPAARSGVHTFPAT